MIDWLREVSRGAVRKLPFCEKYHMQQSLEYEAANVWFERSERVPDDNDRLDLSRYMIGIERYLSDTHTLMRYAIDSGKVDVRDIKSFFSSKLRKFLATSTPCVSGSEDDDPLYVRIARVNIPTSIYEDVQNRQLPIGDVPDSLRNRILKP